MNEWPPDAKDEKDFPKAETDGFDDLKITPEEQAKIDKQTKTDADYHEIVDPNLPVASELDPEIKRQEQIKDVKKSLYDKSKDLVKSLWHNRKNATSPETGPDMDGGSIENYDIVDGIPVLKKKKTALTKIGDKISTAKEFGGALMSEGGKPDGLEKETANISNKFVVENGELKLEEKPPETTAHTEPAIHAHTAHTESHGHSSGAEHHPHAEGHNHHENAERKEIKKSIEDFYKEMEGLSEKDRAILNKLKEKLKFEEKVKTPNTDEDNDEKIVMFMLELGEMLVNSDDFEMSEEKKQKILAKIDAFDTVIWRSERKYQTPENIFKGDATNLEAFKTLSDKKQSAKSECEKKTKELKEKLKTPAGPDKEKFNLEVQKEILGEILKESIAVRENLKEEIKEYRRALVEKQLILAEKKKAMDAAREIAKKAKGPETIKANEAYERAKKEFKDAETIVKTIEVKIKSGEEAFKKIVPEVLKIEVNKAKLEGCKNPIEAAAIVEESEDLQKTIKEISAPTKHEHAHGDHHGHHTSIADRIKSISLLGGGLFSGLFVIFAEQLYKTIRGEKGGGGGGGGHSKPSGGHGGGGHH